MSTTTTTNEITLPLTVPCIPVHRWGYSQAFASNIFMEFERDKAWDEVQQQLSAEFGKDYADNKETYEVRFTDKETVFITFHDDKVYIGSDVRPYGYDAQPLAAPQRPIGK